MLQSMHHPNIIHIEDVYLSDTKICMVRIATLALCEPVACHSLVMVGRSVHRQVTEYMDGGELFDYIVEKGTLSEVEASSFVRKITSAVAYMHACGVIHRDLKPGALRCDVFCLADIACLVVLSGAVSVAHSFVSHTFITENLMLTSKSPHAEVKIIDFGLAKLLEPDDTTESFLGTRVRSFCVVVCARCLEKSDERIVLTFLLWSVLLLAIRRATWRPRCCSARRTRWAWTFGRWA